MLIILVFIEQNCTFSLEVLRLSLSVSIRSGHLPTGTMDNPYLIIWCVVTQNQALTTL